ncbi:MAG: hypothetical protein E7680_07330 [Ruminococcaceae bacterium]|nr:hypothetical protein [Oscillospiraceae bacterium]
MQIDKRTLQILLAMNDDQLSALLTKIAKESGITPADFGATPGDLSGIRRALGSATEDDLKRLNDLYADYRQQKRRQ